MIDASALVALAVGLAAGALNAVAGGGPIIVVAVLAVLGVRADVASLTSTVALLPGQILAGWHGRAGLAGIGPAPARRRLVLLAFGGGALGALLLLVTPAAVFAGLLPVLVLTATGLYALSSRPPRRGDGTLPPRPVRAAWFAPLAVYGGFYGGGNSFMVLALLAHARIDPRTAGHAKNLLILLMNAAASVIFLTSGKVAGGIAWPLAAGALAGSALGAALIDRLDPRRLRWLVIACGTGLGGWLALRG